MKSNSTKPYRSTGLFIFLLLLIQHGIAQTLLTGMPLPNTDVYAFAKDGNTVYMGGIFSQVNSLPHGGLARFDAVTGTLDSWSPVMDQNGVTCLAVVGSKLIAGGYFNVMNGQPHYGICMFDLPSGSLNSWTDTANYTSWRMGIGTYSNYFYYGRTTNFSWNCRIVCVDANTGNFTSWQSDSLIYGSVNAIYVSGTYVYVGGQFTFSGGSSVYDNLCRFDQATGALDMSWHPNPNVNNFGVNGIVKTNSEIFVGGDYNMIAGQSRKGVAAFDAAGNLLPFNQNSSSWEVLTLCADGDFIWVGGNSSTLGGQLRYRIAQIRTSNGLATCWDATATSNTWSTVQAILVTGDTVYAGPYGSPHLSVFNGSPLPLQGSAISGPAAVQPSSAATYSVPYVAGNSYAWSVTGGSGTSTTNSINVTWGAGPSGTVSVLETNPSGSSCSADTSLQVTISASTAVEQLNGQEKYFSIYPNPSHGEFTIHAAASVFDGSTTLSVFDICGREVFKSDGCREPCLVQLGDCPSGIYQLRIECASGSFVEKLVKY